ncbi:MAG: inositol monophosphatase family protein [Myxococcota bacterium]|nr:inositol monophosphatase family protein [Myxococcota bacterium]
MDKPIQEKILAATGAERVRSVEEVQRLWSDYGVLSRVYLVGGSYPSVVLKAIHLPVSERHPRGFAGARSRARKIESYQVERRWYQSQKSTEIPGAPMARALASWSEGSHIFLLLEDLAALGYRSITSASSIEVRLVLRWLARFHASGIGASAAGIWETGSYWHLSTRPDELAVIRGTRLHRFAAFLDARLRCGRFSTLVHGDAKLANFLFHETREDTAAVDFQYVGLGCPMRDLAYFLGGVMSGAECARQESALLADYFSELQRSLPEAQPFAEIEAEWRALYPVAWADFQRFLLGWSPQHHKLTDHSARLTERALTEITEELLSAARRACLAAGRLIQESRGRRLKTQSKGFESPATDILTELDLQAQALILETLRPSIERYEIGLLGEEGVHDKSRLERHAFWAIDPLDGTQAFVEGRSGYATSIALVLRDGEPLMGVVYDPVYDALYETVRGRGVTLNGHPLEQRPSLDNDQTKIKYFADRSVLRERSLELIKERFELHFVGGAVMNVIQLLTHNRSCYFKRPKAALGGCAIWDLAAVSLMLSEVGGQSGFYDGRPLTLNRQESIFFNDVGLCFASADVDGSELLQALESLDQELKTLEVN